MKFSDDIYLFGRRVVQRYLVSINDFYLCCSSLYNSLRSMKLDDFYGFRLRLIIHNVFGILPDRVSSNKTTLTFLLSSGLFLIETEILNYRRRLSKCLDLIKHMKPYERNPIKTPFLKQRTCDLLGSVD